MSQERMNLDLSQNKKTVDSYSAPNLESTLERVDSATQKVRVVHGANEQYFDISGKTVGSIRKSLKEVFNIPNDATPLVSGKEVNDDFIVEGGNLLEFLKVSGVKGQGFAFKI